MAKRSCCYLNGLKPATPLRTLADKAILQRNSYEAFDAVALPWRSLLFQMAVCCVLKQHFIRCLELAPQGRQHDCNFFHCGIKHQNKQTKLELIAIVSFNGIFLPLAYTNSRFLSFKSHEHAWCTKINEKVLRIC